MTTAWLLLLRFSLGEIFKRPQLKTPMLRNTLLELSPSVQYQRRLVNWFWKRWHTEYLKSLTPLKKGFTVGREILGEKGDLVLVSEDHLARGQWQRARVDSNHPGRDGLIRLHLFEACGAYLAAEFDWTNKEILTNIELHENIIDQFVDALHASGGRMFRTESFFCFIVSLRTCGN